MDDKRTPMEAEVQELPQERGACVPGDFYGTAVQPKTRRSHAWAWISLGLGVIAVCTFCVVAALSHVQIKTVDGVLRLLMNDPEQTEATEDPVNALEAPEDRAYTPGPSKDNDAIRISVAPDSGETLTPDEIYDRVAPSVVCIQLEQYYGTSTCTGVVVTENGYILTASDGLSGTIAATVHFQDGTVLSASRVGEERLSGVCLLKVEAQDLPTVRFAADEDLTVGCPVYCIGNPYGTAVPNVFYDGMLSAVSDASVNGTSFTVLMSSAAQSGVGCGCPVLDSAGRILGMTTTIGKRVVSGSDVCLAVSAQDLERVVAGFAQSLSSGGTWLGLTVSDIPEEYYYLYGFPGAVWIDEVAAGTGLYGVLCQYDVITAVDDMEIQSAADFDRLIAAHSVGDKVRLTIYRSGKWYQITLPVRQR